MNDFDPHITFEKQAMTILDRACQWIAVIALAGFIASIIFGGL